MLSLTPEEMKALSEFWERLQDVPPSAREEWIASLEVGDGKLREALARMARRDEEAGAAALLYRPPTTVFASWPGAAPEPREDDQVGPYRLVRELGRGGMGVVWLGERADGLMQRQVAIKLPHPWLVGSCFMRRFAQERQILASLTHPNIARLYEAGLTEGAHPYLALEYIDGEPINAYCETRALDVPARLALFLQVLDAVQFAHDRRVVHRDLKPSNILVSGDGRAHLLDFGTAKLLEQGDIDNGLTQFGDAALTPIYASPEQISGAAVGPQSDVFALGVLLFELLAGKLPYRLQRPTRAAMEDAVLAGSLRPPSQASTECKKRARALRGDLDAIVLTAMERDLARRYVSVQAFAEDLRRHLAGQRVRARRDSAWIRHVRFVKRHWRGAAATSAVVLGLGIALVVSVRAGQEARREKVFAQQQAAIARQQEAAANQNARTTSEVVKFLKGLFSGNQPQVRAAHEAGDVTARELLDIGAANIDEALSDAPETKERLLETIAQMYQEIDARDRAAEISRKRVAVARTLHDPGRRRLVAALLDLANAGMNADGPDAAKAQLDEAEQLLNAPDSAQPGDNALRGRLELRRGLLLSQSDAPAASRHIERAVHLLADGGDLGDYLSSLTGQAYFQLMQGEGLDRASERLDEVARRAPTDDPLQLEALALNCDVVIAMGRRERALDLCQQAFEGAARAYQDGDESYEVIARRYAAALSQFGRVDVARVLLRSRVATLVATPDGRRSPSLAADYVALASTELDAGHPVRAKSWLDAQVALHLEEAKLDGMQIRPLPELALSRLALQQGRFGSALSIARAGLLSAARYGVAIGRPGDRLRATIVRARIGLGDVSGAVAALADFDQALAAAAGEAAHPASAARIESLLLHAQVALAQGHWQGAMDGAEALRRLVQAQPSPELFMPTSLASALVAGWARLGAGHVEDAAREFETARSLAARLAGDGLFDAQAQHGLSVCEERLGHAARARALAAAAQAIARREHARWPLAAV